MYVILNITFLLVYLLCIMISTALFDFLALDGTQLLGIARYLMIKLLQIVMSMI